MHALRNINVQLGLVLLLCVGLFHAAVTTILLLSEPAPGDPRDQAAAVVVAAVTALDAASPKERLAIAAALNASLPEIRLALTDVDRAAQTGAHPVYFQSRLPDGVTITGTDVGDQKKSLGFLHDGQSIVLDTFPLTPGFDRFALVTIGFVAISLFVFSLWAAVSLTRPLTNFANVAEDFGLDSIPAQLPETGPEEVRKATRAFNRMQRRIAEMAAQRTRMLAAVSHDLLTPITRMRLRAEYLEKGDTQAKLQRDLDQMEAMVGGCLAYLRGGAQQEMAPLDLASLLQAVVDQFIDMGSNVRYSERNRINVRGNPDDLDRVFSNLLDNAVKYAANPEIRLFERDGDAIVEVIDSGPGIPLDQRAAMLEPFERGNVDTTAHIKEGFGLGLAIARAIVEAHGGRLALDERVGGGLIARVFLPKVDIETR